VESAGLATEPHRVLPSEAYVTPLNFASLGQLTAGDSTRTARKSCSVRRPTAGILAECAFTSTQT